jgi:hypothetical protein
MARNGVRITEAVSAFSVGIGGVDGKSLALVGK